MVIHWRKKKHILQGLADRRRHEISLWNVPPQRLRAQWQLGIRNKTTNWISHHYHPTLWPARIPGSEEWKSRLIYEEEEEDEGAHLGHWDFHNSYWTTYHKLVRAGTTVSHEPTAHSRANRSSIRPNYCHLNPGVEVIWAYYRNKIHDLLFFPSKEIR